MKYWNVDGTSPMVKAYLKITNKKSIEGAITFYTFLLAKQV